MDNFIIINEAPVIWKITFFYIKKGEKYIGGFTISRLATLRYKPVNMFNKCFVSAADHLGKNKYEYFGHFIILKEYREKGVGSFVLKSFFSKNNKKVWFVPNSKKNEYFYLSNGAFVYSEGSETIMTIN